MSAEAIHLQRMLPDIYKDPSYLDKALTAGDSESEDREGQRGLSQVGDALMRFIILCEGFHRGLSRQEQQDSLSALGSKAECAKLARRLGIDRLIKYSPRQGRAGPQPGTLKNTLCAIVATAYYSSGNMESVMHVMATLGIINHTQHCVDPQDLTLITSPDMETSMDNTEGSSDSFDFDDLIDLSPLIRFEASELDSVDVQSSPELLSDPVNDREQKQNAKLKNDLQQPGAFPSGSTAIMALDRTTQGEFEGYRFQHITDVIPEPGNHCPADQSDEVSDQVPCTESQTSSNKRSRDVTSVGGTKAGKALKSLKTSETRKNYDASVEYSMKNRCAAYVESEVRNGATDREELKGFLWDYSVAIRGLGASRPDILLSVALGFGNCNAMLTLQQAVESVRSASVTEAVCVGRQRPVEERLAAIRHLDLRMAHFRLARRLHIYHLCLEAESTCDQVESDGFVFVTPWKQKTPNGSTRCGNPRNDRKAQVTNAMIERGSTYLTRRETGTQGRDYFNTLRRFGTRLKKLRDKYSIGAFAFFDDTLDENIIRTAGDKAFDDFVTLIDRIDGQMIRSLSSAACSIIQLVDGNGDHQGFFKIETVSPDYIESLPRGSADMEELLRPI